MPTALRQPSLWWKQRSRASKIALLLGGAVALALALFMVSSVLVYRHYANGLAPPDEVVASSGYGSSAVYDRTGQTRLHQYADPLGGVRSPVALSEISPYLIAATLATEDPTFFDNPGVDVRGLARAAWENLTPFGPGFFQGSGGSSITQQLARNLYLTEAQRRERSIDRKVKETVIALELKRKYNDDQILEWYLNQIYYGDHAYGIQAASQRYFGKTARDLSLAEAALLAGLPQSPSNYSPAILENRDRARERQLQVLKLMGDNMDSLRPFVSLSPQDIEAATHESLTYAEPAASEIKAPHFTYAVEGQIKEMCSAGLFMPPAGVDCLEVATNGGLAITTSLDMTLQGIAESVLEEELTRSEASTGGHNGSLVAIKPDSGEVLAYAGSRSFFRGDLQGQVDIASSLQSHGSSMKVFTYLAGFEQGWKTSKVIEDKPLVLGDEGRQVNNWNATYLGRITVRRALAESVNTAAVRAAMEVGPENVRGIAHRLGVTDLPDDTCGPPITLGACDVKLTDMTFAFATLANRGMMKGRPTSGDWPDGYRAIDPVTVLRIVDNSGNIIYERGSVTEQRVVEEEHVDKLTDILSKDTVKWSRLEIDRPAAAKTGTSDEFRDGVVMGYTPFLAVGTWVGNADNSPMAPGSFSNAAAGPLWKRFMEEAHAVLGLPPQPFAPISEKPGGTPVCSGENGTRGCESQPSRTPPSVPPVAAPTDPEATRPAAGTSPTPEAPEPSAEPTPDPTEEPETTPDATPTPDPPTPEP